MKRGQALQSLPSGPIARCIVAFYSVGILLFVVATPFLALRDHGVVPTWDEIELLLDMFAMPFLDWLFSSQHGHLLPLTRLIFAVDYYAFDGQKSLLIAVSFVLLVLSSVVLWRALHTDGGLDAPLSRLLFGWMTLTIFWAASVYNLLCGVCNANTVVLLFSLIALTGLARHASRRRAGRASVAALVWSLVAAVLATVGLAQGVAIWPALLVVALGGRLPLRDIGLIAAAGLGVGALFAMGTVNESGVSAIQSAVDQPLELLLFTATLLGSAPALTSGAAGWLEESITPASTTFGTIGLAAVAAHAVWTWRSRVDVSPHGLVAFGITTFAAAVAFGISVNRLTFGPEQADALRFFDWSALFWIGVAATFAAFARPGSGSFWVGSAVVAVTTAIMLATLPGLRSTLVKRGADDADAALAVLVGVAGSAERNRLYWDAFELAKLTKRLRDERKSLFADPRAEWIGQRLTALFSLAPQSRCQGEMIQPAPVRESEGAKLQGWAWDQEKEAPPESIVLVSRAGVVKGLGNTHRRTETLLPGTSAPRAQWKAWGTKYGPKVDYLVYGVIDEGRKVCRVVGKR